jgi:hypothetical protein
MWPNTPTSIWEMSSVGFQLRKPTGHTDSLTGLMGLFVEETVISTENVPMIGGKSNSGSVRPIVHVCGLSVDVSDSEMTIHLSDAH